MHPQQWLLHEPARISGIMAQHAVGVAGAMTGWASGVGDDDGRRAAPQVWRIGTAVADADPERIGWPIGVPLLDESHLQIDTAATSRGAAETLIETLLARVVRYYAPDRVHLDVWDIGQFTGALPALYPLTDTGLLTVHRSDQLGALLDDLAVHITRVHTRALSGGLSSVKAVATTRQEREEPWRVVVLLGNHTALPDQDRLKLERIARGGLACGISLILVDIRGVVVHAPVEQLRFTPDGVRTSITGEQITVFPDPPPPFDQLVTMCTAISRAHAAALHWIGTFDMLLPPAGEWGQASARSELVAPIGFVRGRPVSVRVFDGAAHVLIGGPSGTGKTNFIYGMLGSLAVRYPPHELAIYMIDLKEGVSFAQFADGAGGSWLPHARLVGINCNGDPEFGYALLEHLGDELRRRARAFKRHRVTKLSDLRDKDPDGHWPRIVAVIDEFQYLFAEDDQRSADAARMLEDLARRARSMGIHLVLASQDVASIDAFWARPACFEQFVLRVALPGARGVVKGEIADGLQRHAEVVINHEGGAEQSNQVVRVPDMSALGTLDRIQLWAHATYPSAPPRLFDGDDAPSLAALMAQVSRDGVPRAVLGQRVTMAGDVSTAALTPGTGRHIAIVGSVPKDSLRLLDAVAESLTGQGKRVDLDLVTGMPPAQVTAELTALVEEIKRRRRDPSLREPWFVVVRGADAIPLMADTDGLAGWRTLLRSGAELGVHVVGWWRSVGRLKSLFTTSLDLDPEDIGILVGLDVQGDAFGSLLGGVDNLMLAWRTRPHRALLFDRLVHSGELPEVLITPGGDEPEEP